MIKGIDAWHALEKLSQLAVFAAVITVACIFALRPLLIRYALARPNARSSHDKPTPQGGGIAVIGATIVVTIGASLLAPELVCHPAQIFVVVASAIGLAIVGLIDDIHPLNATPRIILQTAATAFVVAELPFDLQISPALPWWFERVCILLGCVWFVNLVNFMDGIDWMTVVEVVPVTFGLALFSLMGALPQHAAIVAVALAGAIIGFAPFNRPIAQLFLGDVGSLPIGLILSWLLVLLAGRGHLAAALLLPLYYLADATITLVRRLVRGDPITQAHRNHFYQRAMTGGFRIYQIVGSVFCVNIVLVALAATSIKNPSVGYQFMTLAAGSAMVGALLWKLGSAKRS